MIGAMREVEKVKLLDCDLPKIVLAGPLSRKTTFALHITGPYSDVEATNLIRLLELQCLWLKRDANDQGSEKP